MDIARINGQKEFTKRRTIANVLITFALVVLVLVAWIVKDFKAQNAWLMWIAIAYFAASTVAFLCLTKCPFCKKMIVSGAMLATHCPHCKKQIVEKLNDRQLKRYKKTARLGVKSKKG